MELSYRLTSESKTDGLKDNISGVDTSGIIGEVEADEEENSYIIEEIKV